MFDLSKKTECHLKVMEAKASDLVSLCYECGTLLIDLEATREALLPKDFLDVTIYEGNL